MAPLGAQVKMDPGGRLGQPGLLDGRAIKAETGQQETKETLVPQDASAPQERLGQPERLAAPEHGAMWATQDPSGQLDRQVRRAIVVLMAVMGPRARMARQEQQGDKA